MKPSPESRDRRPVPGRDWWITRRAVDLLVALGISPNLASALGMMFGLAAGGWFALTRTHPGPLFWLLGALFVFLRSAFNVFDGMIAHRTGQKSRWGAFVNDFTDRIADVGMLVGFGYAWHAHPELGYLAAVAALLTATVRTTGRAVGASMHYGGVMSKPVRMYTLILAALAMALIPRPWIPDAALGLVTLGSLLTTFQRMVRIFQELREG